MKVCKEIDGENPNSCVIVITGDGSFEFRILSAICKKYGGKKDLVVSPKTYEKKK